MAASRRALVALSVATGLVLALIGVRFLLAPDGAARFFGIGRASDAAPLHHIIGLRDLWLGGLAIGLAWLRQWHGLALWFGLGALVCLGDALIVVTTRGPATAIAFHAASGAFCLAMALLTLRAGRTNP